MPSPSQGRRASSAGHITSSAFAFGLHEMRLYQSRFCQSAAFTIRYWLLGGRVASSSYTNAHSCRSKFSSHSAQAIGRYAPAPGKLNRMPAPPSCTLTVAGPLLVASPVAGSACRFSAHRLITSWSRVNTTWPGTRMGEALPRQLRQGLGGSPPTVRWRTGTDRRRDRCPRCRSCRCG